MFEKFKLNENYEFILDKEINKYSMIKEVIVKKLYYCHTEENLCDRLVLIKNFENFKVTDISFENIKYVEEFVEFCWNYFNYPKEEIESSEDYSNLDAFHDWFTDEYFFEENHVLIFRKIKDLKSKNSHLVFTQLDIVKELLDICGNDGLWFSNKKIYIFLVN
ncbi:hypothetical protein [Sebaldella sp. S0638]|uniref:hypothetical protein n=1 Tax=Sebaldella sp. S0638 TaxID=2957809 RepID=UPI00209DEBED|nr:hypothetical protein [Sebaldella sp. S0638]MCP1225876.1 hypothetical protein [Sebaldella sp. S0638]